MKKFIIVTLILALAVTACLCFTACNKVYNKAKIVDIDYSKVLVDYLKYPNADNDASMQEIQRNVKDIYEDTTLTDAQKVAQMMARATKNEIDCAYFAYFRDQKGETKMGSNKGQLIYQRLRRQSDTLKDDTTIKMPVNATFGSIERKATTSADIRFTNNGKYNRMNNKSPIVYNESTGLLEVATWKKQSSDNWNKPEDAKGSRSDEEARKTCVNWNVENVVDSKDITIELRTDDNGNKYFYLKFSINVDAANADKTTIANLENDNGGSGMKYNYSHFEMEIWENGLAKKYIIDGSWSGKIAKIYSGSAQSKSTIIFSYSEADLDYSKTDAIYKGILKK